MNKENKIWKEMWKQCQRTRSKLVRRIKKTLIRSMKTKGSRKLYGKLSVVPRTRDEEKKMGQNLYTFCTVVKNNFS